MNGPPVAFEKRSFSSLITHLIPQRPQKIKAHTNSDVLASFKKENGINSTKIVLFIGRLLPDKKPDILIHAMKTVVAKISDAHAVIIGDGPMRNAIEELIAKLCLSNSVTLTGAIHNEEIIAKYLLCSRAMIMPAGAGLAIQHAFSYSVPVIIGDDMLSHGPEAELVVNEKTGLYCPDGNDEFFAAAIYKILTDDELHNRLSENAYKVIETKYNIKNMAKGFFDAVAYCMEIKPPSGSHLSSLR